ncbi:DUF3347 domain-containing protein [Chryseobacterium echinoideorum]|uniref:DUF3347 domain-containing protein n=1 Tax=Chryseobacterium echinoideorum TaxID=1549648 RepID=UPI0011869762|nr:DUF3347 domain-containing protein [Chryseobacterium echinoideorum]
MKSISKILMAITVLLSSINIFAQVKNAKTETIKIYGNCDMCKSNIEKAGNLKNIAQVNWNKDTKIATLIYDEKKTNHDEILKRIALAGYDSEKFLAPDDVYSKLPECCQYKRELKPTVLVKDNAMDMKSEHNNHNHNEMVMGHSAQQNQPTFKSVFENYFSLKDALIKSDGATASTKASALTKAIQSIDMTKLSSEEHTVWMNVMKDLAFDAEHISDTKDASHQRDHFTSLSDNIYKVMKVTKQDTPVYYQNCPMFNNGKGANWLSKEEAVKNPYYGSQMLSCGSTVETLK